jgi:hypothetical protein
MELKDFVSETINQIADGVKASNEYLKKINEHHRIEENEKVVINFDVVVTVSETNTNTIGGKLNVTSFFSAGAGNTNDNKSFSNNRVSFSLIAKFDTKQRSQYG